MCRALSITYAAPFKHDSILILQARKGLPPTEELYCTVMKT